MKRFEKLFAAEDGATMVEYAILASLIALVSIVVVKSVGTHVKALFTTVQFP